MEETKEGLYIALGESFILHIQIHTVLYPSSMEADLYLDCGEVVRLDKAGGSGGQTGWDVFFVSLLS